MASPLQHRQTPFIAGISATCAAGLYARATPSGWNARYAVVSLTLVQNIRQAKAGQLNFQNFVTTVEVKANSVNGGNKNLIPETLWRVELTWEHAFSGGSFTLTGRHEFISNLVDRIAIQGVGGELDASGNIGDARRDEFQASLVWPVTWPPLSDLTIQATGLYRFTEATDPQTYLKRSISVGLLWEGKLTLIQDLPAWSARLGASYTMLRGGNQWRFNEIQTMRVKAPATEFFAEYKPTPQWLVRGFVRNAFDIRNLRSRHVYLDNRATGVESSWEYRRLTFGPSIGLYVQRSFGQ